MESSAFPWKCVLFGEKIISYCFIHEKIPIPPESGTHALPELVAKRMYILFHHLVLSWITSKSLAFYSLTSSTVKKSDVDWQSIWDFQMVNIAVQNT